MQEMFTKFDRKVNLMRNEVKGEIMSVQEQVNRLHDKVSAN